MLCLFEVLSQNSKWKSLLSIAQMRTQIHLGPFLRSLRVCNRAFDARKLLFLPGHQISSLHWPFQFSLSSTPLLLPLFLFFPLFSFCSSPFWLFGHRILLYSQGWPGTHYVAQAGFELVVILFLEPLEHQEERCVIHHA